MNDIVTMKHRADAGSSSTPTRGDQMPPTMDTSCEHSPDVRSGIHLGAGSKLPHGRSNDTIPGVNGRLSMILPASPVADCAPAKPAAWRRGLPLLWLLPFVLAFGLFQLAPIVWVMVNSFQAGGEWSLANFREILGSPFYLQSFGNSIDLAVCSSLLGLLIGLAGTAALRQVPGRLQDAVVAFTTMASNFSGVPLAFAFIVLLGMNGALTLLLREAGLIDSFNLYSRAGLIALYGYFQIPLAVLLLYPAFDGIKKDWSEAAALLGASPRQYWLRVVLPVLAPALIGTFIILLANALGAYASAYALMTSNYNLLTIQIAGLVAGDIFLEPQLAAALSLLLMLLLFAVTAINQWLIARSRYE